MTDIPIVAPDTITAGNTLEFTITLDDYPATTWDLSYILLNSSDKITITSSADGADHAVDVAAATTADYTPGVYKYTALVTDGTDRYTVDTGEITVLPDPSEATSYDGRTFEEVSLANIEAILQNKATADNYSYSIAGRSLSKYSWDELISARNYFKSIVTEQKLTVAGKITNKILVRFV